MLLVSLLGGAGFDLAILRLNAGGHGKRPVQLSCALLVLVTLSEAIDLLGGYGEAALFDLLPIPLVQDVTFLFAPVLFLCASATLREPTALSPLWHAVPAGVCWSLFLWPELTLTGSEWLILAFWITFAVYACLYLIAMLRLLFDRVHMLKGFFSNLPEGSVSRIRRLWLILGHRFRTAATSCFMARQKILASCRNRGPPERLISEATRASLQNEETKTMTTLKIICTAACIALGTMAAEAEEFWDANALQNAHGTYRSAAPEPWYGGFGTREFVFANGRWELIFTHALDPAMTMRTFVFRTGGAYEIGGPNNDVTGAYDGTFFEEWKHVTLLTDVPEVIAGMGMAGCVLTPNLETDISQSGCAAWRPVAECGADHDILAMTDTGLQFGVRPADNDMCTPDRRPTALLPVVAKFQ